MLWYIGYCHSSFSWYKMLISFAAMQLMEFDESKTASASQDGKDHKSGKEE